MGSLTVTLVFLTIVHAFSVEVVVVHLENLFVVVHHAPGQPAFSSFFIDEVLFFIINRACNYFFSPWFFLDEFILLCYFQILFLQVLLNFRLLLYLCLIFFLLCFSLFSLLFSSCPPELIKSLELVLQTL
jgi:hypothetical protein